MAVTDGYDDKNAFKDTSRATLPKHIFKDGAKWLMIPSKTVLDSLSVWPERQNNTTAFLHLLVILSYVILVIGNYYYITDKETDLGSAMYAVSILVVTVETVARRVLCYVYKEKLSKILYTVYFEFWPSTIIGKDLHNEVTKDCKHFFVIWGINMLLAFLCGLQYAILPMMYENTPLRTVYPFAWREGYYFAIPYIWQACLGIEFVFNTCGLDLFFNSLLMNCVAQFKLLRTFLKERFEEAIRQTEGAAGYNRKNALEVVLIFIHHHNKLIRVCEEIDKAFTLHILVQFLTSITTVCASGFAAITVPEVIGNSVTYMGGHICEILIYCYVGNELSLQSMELASTAYQCGVHLPHTDTDLQKTLMMIMVRSQKPIRISAGGFGYLSLQTFLKLLQFSFSVFTLLIKMNNKNKL